MDLSLSELKFLLQLLTYAPAYRTRISKIKPESKTSATERDRICKALDEKGLVSYSQAIQRYSLEPAAKALLTADPGPVLPSVHELALLTAARKGTATPSQARTVPAATRQALLIGLEQRGMIAIQKQQIWEVWLMPQGAQYLRHDCLPTSAKARVSFALLGHYVQFLRQPEPTGPQSAVPTQASKSASDAPTALSSEQLLTIIRQLDQQFDTDNFLPLFHLRNHLQTAISRDQLDALLYRLQGQDIIELITLQEADRYSDAERAAGIPQAMGGPLFYISVAD